MSRDRLTLFAPAICLAVASCSATVSPPPFTPPTSTTSTTTTSTVLPPPPVTGPLEKDWKSYGGTAYFGCPEKFSAAKSALDDIRPKVFDTKTGQYVAPALPTVPAGENLEFRFGPSSAVFGFNCSDESSALKPSEVGWVMLTF